MSPTKRMRPERSLGTRRIPYGLAATRRPVLMEWREHSYRGNV